MIINKSGITIRTGVDELRVMGRATQGVRLISLRGNDQIASVCRVPKSDEEDVNEDDSPDSSEDQANPESTTE
jgi:DNA gyrase subunit A